MFLINKQKGLTLMESVIYIALFTLIITTTVVTAYELLKGSDSLNSKTTIQTEGHFFLRKMNWILSGMNPASVPVISGVSCAKNITLSKLGFSENPIEVRLESGKIEMRTGGSGDYIPLTTENVTVECLDFELLSSSAYGIKASSTIEGFGFSTTKYTR